MPSGVIQSSDDRGLSRSSLAASFSQSAGVFFGKSAMMNYVAQRSSFATPPLSPPPSYGGGWEGEGTSHGVCREEIMTWAFSTSFVRLAPPCPPPYDGGGKEDHSFARIVFRPKG